MNSEKAPPPLSLWSQSVQVRKEANMYSLNFPLQMLNGYDYVKIPFEHPCPLAKRSGFGLAVKNHQQASEPVRNDNELPPEVSVLRANGV